MSDEPSTAEPPFPLCPSCTERRRQAERDGKIGIALCQECTDRYEADVAKREVPASPAKPDEHPAPWRWEDGEEGNDSPTIVESLRDADGRQVLSPSNDERLILASPVVRELLRLAPEMEAALRMFLGRPEACEVCSVFGGHRDDCKLVAILAALDAARAAKP